MRPDGVRCDEERSYHSFYLSSPDLNSWPNYFTSERAAMYCDVYDMSVYLFVHITQQPHGRTSPNFYECRSWLIVLLWRRCYTLCTSSFVDDVMFHTTGQMCRNKAQRYVSKKFASWRYQGFQTTIQRLAEFIRVQHRGRSLPSTIDLFYLSGVAARANWFACCETTQLVVAATNHSAIGSDHSCSKLVKRILSSRKIHPF